jgi:hypothetical protein
VGAGKGSCLCHQHEVPAGADNWRHGICRPDLHHRKPFEEAIARLEAINTQIKAAQASGPASDLIPIIEKAQPELQESIDGLRFSVRGTDPELGIALPSLVTTAYAAVTDTELVYSTDQRTILVTVIIIFIAVFWVFCFVLYFFSKDKEKVKFAATMIQTVLGFFIGIVTGMIGSPRR